jgi:hypothetical protein
MKMDEFYTYVLSFYGKGGLYPMGATLADVKAATKQHKKQIYIPFEADSFDRECVRDILIKDFGYTWPLTTQEDITMLGKSEQTTTMTAHDKAKHMIRWMEERNLTNHEKTLCVEFAFELGSIVKESQDHDRG